MNKSIEFTQSQIKAYQNGAKMFIVPIDTKGMKMSEIGLKKDLLQFAPIQKGDKDIFIKEEFCHDIDEDCSIQTKHDFKDSNTYYDWCDYLGVESQDASQMTKEQSRYTISECIDVRVVRVRDIDIFDAEELGINIDDSICWRDYEKIIKGTSNPYYLPMYDECPLEDIRIRIESFYNQQMQEQNINRTYEDNDYVFLIEIKR